MSENEKKPISKIYESTNNDKNSLSKKNETNEFLKNRKNLNFNQNNINNSLNKQYKETQKVMKEFDQVLGETLRYCQIMEFEIKMIIATMVYMN